MKPPGIEMGLYILDDQGEPVPCADPREWAEWMHRERDLAEEGGRLRVDKTMVGHVRVSTIFLAIDHAFGSGPPLLWETMAFYGGDGSNDDQWRWHTRREAEEGHAAVVAWLRGEIEMMGHRRPGGMN